MAPPPRLSIAHGPKRARLLSLALLALIAIAPASASAATERTGRLLVMVDKDAQRRAAPLIERQGVRRAGEQVPEIGLVTVKPDAGQSLAAAAAALRELPGVTSVTAERRYEMRLIPNDPALQTVETAPGTPAGTAVQWWIGRQNMFAAWDITRGAGAKVAVIDLGVDGQHPELAGKIAAAFDNELAEYDTGPADFDLDGHGTHVSSMACGAGDNGTGIVGAGLDCKLIVAKIDRTDGSVARSLVQATDAGADAISMSFGTNGAEPAPPAIVEGIDYALARNVVLVAAAANEAVTEQGDPANLLQPTGTGPDLNSNRGLSVTSADFSGRRSVFAGRGTQISMAAFGSFAFGSGNGPRGLLGAFPANNTITESGVPAEGVAPCGCRSTFNADTRYAYLAGTSIATPQVAAIAALMAHFNPDLLASQIVRILKQTASRAPGTGWEQELGWGILDAGRALAVTRTTDRTRPTSKARGPRGVRRSTRLTLKWTGRDRNRHPGLVASGIAKYELWRSANGAKYRRIARTARLSKRLRLRRGARYRFYTVAIDKSANREARPARSDVSFRVSRR